LQQQLAAAPRARVLRTDQAGNVTFTTKGTDFRIRPLAVPQREYPQLLYSGGKKDYTPSPPVRQGYRA
jgi:hypothetical protein